MLPMLKPNQIVQNTNVFSRSTGLLFELSFCVGSQSSFVGSNGFGSGMLGYVIAGMLGIERMRLGVED